MWLFVEVCGSPQRPNASLAAAVLVYSYTTSGSSDYGALVCCSVTQGTRVLSLDSTLSIEQDGFSMDGRLDWCVCFVVCGIVLLCKRSISFVLLTQKNHKNMLLKSVLQYLRFVLS